MITDRVGEGQNGGRPDRVRGWAGWGGGKQTG